MTKYIWECCRLLGANSENAIASMQKSFWLTSIFCWLTLPVLAEPTNLTVQRQAPIHAIARIHLKLLFLLLKRKGIITIFGWVLMKIN
ncbi:MAG: hypothetical protein HC763_26185 [Hydrococcus sp. CRU_1_1]|nr:hypothetical protein [Hydrococcus sp. CRU_1_1]